MSARIIQVGHPAINVGRNEAGGKFSKLMAFARFTWTKHARDSALSYARQRAEYGRADMNCSMKQATLSTRLATKICGPLFRALSPGDPLLRSE